MENDSSIRRSTEELLKYYARTSEQYDSMHEGELEHEVALRLITGFVFSLRARTVLDVGTGTGRGVAFLSRSISEVKVFGVDFSYELLREGLSAGKLNCGTVCVTDATALPFPDGAFDLCIETGILHHVPNPARIIDEMLRVCRVGIALSDNNMYVAGDSFGILPGGILGATVKMALCRAGIWRALKRIVRGKEWSYSEGDGVFWTYSLYDSMSQLRKSCSQVFLIPLRGGNKMHEVPILDASHLLVVAIKKGI